MYLNCHSYYSFKYGTLSVERLLQCANEKGVNTFALTDINNTSACLDFIREAPKFNVMPIVGIDFREGVKQHYVGIAKNNEGFFELNQHLSSILKGGRLLEEKAPSFQNSYVVYPFGSIRPSRLKEYEYIGIKPNELTKLALSKQEYSKDKLVALSSVTFQNKKDFNAHRLLRAIDNNTLLSKLPLEEQANPQNLFYSEKELKAIYEHHHCLLSNAKQLLDNCSIEFEYRTSKNKKYFIGKKEDVELLHSKCYEGLRYRYGSPGDKIKARLEHELSVINKMGFASYFLINWDIVNYARKRGFFYVGRGSGANSIAAYCLGITDVDPVDLDLYFERFINSARTSPPDFDIDFSWRDRDEIINYIFQKYSIDHASLLATYQTFKDKSVIRELGKVFGLPKAEIDELVEYRKAPHELDNIAKLVYKYSAYIHGFPSHLSIHAGGILISEKPINYYTATSIPPKGFPLTQFSMIQAEDIGLYKFDILSQRGLGHIKDTIAIVKRNRGDDIDIHDIARLKRDPLIKEHLRMAKAMGCFYVESPAMRMLLKKLKAETYLDLVAASSIIRPGVAKSGMMREYILRFQDKERRNQAHPELAKLMPETFGIMVYQEDVIKVAHLFAGLTLDEADALRRGMSGKFKARDEFQKAKDVFFKNCRSRGHNMEDTKEIWRQIESFAGYAFSKGHSASYAVESYQSLFLKAYYPKEFMVGVINNFGGFYQTEYYIHEARMSGANIMAPCVNNSEYLTSINGDDIYLGFIHVGELDEKVAFRLVQERDRNGAFLSLEDMMNRVDISVEHLRILIRIGALRFCKRTKKKLLWDVYTILGNKRKTKPIRELFPIDRRRFKLPQLYDHPLDDALDEIEILGFPLVSPFSLIRQRPEHITLVAQLAYRVGEQVNMLGYSVTRKRTSTTKGEEMNFGTFLDEEGQFIDTVHFPPSLKSHPFRGKGCYHLRGKVVEEFGFLSLEVDFMERLEYMNRDELIHQKNSTNAPYLRNTNAIQTPTIP